MEKKNGSRLAALLLYGIVLMLVTGLVIALPWAGIPLGLVCIFSPRTMWKIFGGFVHPSEKPSIFAVNRMRKVGILLFVTSIGRMLSDSLLGK